MGFNGNIKKEIAKIAHSEKSSISEKQFYESAYLKEYLESLSGTMLGSQKKKLSVKILSDGPKGLTACTDGNMILINWQNELFSRYATQEDRFIVFMGAFLHEMSHVLYLDFNLQNKAYNELSAGRMYGAEPDNLSPEMENELIELQYALANKSLSPLFMKIYHDLDNVFSDRHDEDVMIREWGTMAVSGIGKVRESLLNSIDIYDKTEEDVKKGAQTALSAFYSAVLEYSRFDEITVIDQALWNKSEVLKTIREVGNYVEVASWTDDYAERYGAMNCIVLYIWKFIKDEVDKEKRKDQNQQGSSDPSGKKKSKSSKSQDSSSSSQVTAEDVAKKLQEIMGQLDRASNSMPQSEAPKKRSSSQQAQDKRADARKGNSKSAADSKKPDDQTKADSEKQMKEILQTVKYEIAENIAERAMEKELASQLEDTVRAVNQNSTHKNIPVQFSRQLDNKNESAYHTIMTEVKPYSKRLQKNIEDALKDMKEGGLVKHKPYGKVFRAQDTYRPDGLYYARKKLPQDLPDMAVAVLVDNSGSMSSNGRIEAAMKASVLLYDFATSLNIPVAVFGHSANYYNGVTFKTYADFERANTDDKYRICTMVPDGCNRDGCALEIAANLLSQRPEDVKMLIIVSDGRPNHSNYGGELAMQDIQSIVRRYRAKGVEILAAAIGEDRETIKKIYTDGFIDIRDLSKLPREMTRLVKKRILKNAN